MTLISDSIDFFRQQWADRIENDGDSCIIRRQVDEDVDEDGVITPVYADPNPYEGPCIWRPGVQTDEQFGEQQVELRFGTVFLPYDESGFKPDDEVVMTSTRDDELDGKVLVVRNVGFDSYNTRRALFCEDNQGG